MSRDEPRRCPATRVPQCGPPAAHLAVRPVAAPVVVAVVVAVLAVVVIIIVVKITEKTKDKEPTYLCPGTNEGVVHLQGFRSVGRRQHTSLSGLSPSLQ